jgi:CDP-glucose 4,6-dehydratase
LESLELAAVTGVDPGFWRGKRVLLTGHTGFKGSWAALWLSRMGADVTGMALAPDTEPNLYGLAAVARDIHSILLDIRDRDAVADAVKACAPQIVLHLAAQSLVRRAAREPIDTVATNVMGSVHLLDALRMASDLEAVLVVTTDKVYRNDERRDAFAEDDRLGGHEPYAASKAAADLLTRAFGDSYFEPRGVPVATARGGNVLGGGDFAEDRLVPDIVRATLKGAAVVLRNPNSTRPWQHVLDCLAGYFCYLQALAEKRNPPRALNFASIRPAQQTVAQIADSILAALGNAAPWVHGRDAGPRESRFLSLDARLAHSALGWSDRYDGTQIVERTAAWYREFGRGGDMRAACLAQIDDFIAGALPRPSLDARATVDPAAVSR